MKITLDGFERALDSTVPPADASSAPSAPFGRRAATKSSATPVGTDLSADLPATSDAAPTPVQPATRADVSTAPASPAPSQAHTPAHDAVGAPASGGGTPNATGPVAARRRLWSKRADMKVVQPASPPTQKKGNPRVWVGAGIILILGIIAGPWIAQTAIPDAPQPAGPGGAASAVAETLKASALGVAIGPVDTQQPAPLPASASLAADPPIPSKGEGRYLSMLDQVRSGGIAPIEVVPKVQSQTAPTRDGQTYAAPRAPRPPINPYPDTPISLSIEGSVDQAAAANTPLRVTNETAPNGRYLVLRIAADQGGHTAALVMPLGGRPALDAAWIRSGDRTVDGFTIEAVESKLVRVRTPANRVIYWTPQQ